MVKDKRKPLNKPTKQDDKGKHPQGDHKSKRRVKSKKTQADHVDHIPFKLREILKGKERMEKALEAGKKVKGTFFPINKPEPSTYEDIPVPHFKRKKKESVNRYVQRMDNAASHVLFLTNNQVERKPELEEEKQEKPAGVEKSEKKKLYEKARTQKQKLKKLERFEEEMEKDRFQDEVAFGEVSMEPPQLTSKPRKAPIKTQYKDLLLNSLLGHTTSSTAKPSMARKRIMEEERERAVEAYRLLKKQKLQQQEAQRIGMKKLKNPK